jgi:hypothetical protein
MLYARAIDEAEVRLKELRQEERERLGLAALAIGVSIAATEFFPSLTAPLFIGGLAIGALGVRALWRRWDLLERLAGEADAYVIPEVFSYASREATMGRRHSFAALIRRTLRDPGVGLEARVVAVADDLEALASELDDDGLSLDPASAVATMRLLSDVAQSPLLNPALPTEDLRARLLHIRTGFRPRRLAALSGQSLDRGGDPLARPSRRRDAT